MILNFKKVQLEKKCNEHGKNCHDYNQTFTNESNISIK